MTTRKEEAINDNIRSLEEMADLPKDEPWVNSAYFF